MVGFSLAGEGILDLAVGRKILAYYGHAVFAEFDKGGKDRLDRSLPGFQNASRHSPWFILRDLDQDECAVSLLDKISPRRADFDQMILRVCIKSVESWLLADLQGFAQFFGIPTARMNFQPDNLASPKESLVRLVEGSRHKNLREGVVPRRGSGRRVGPEYNAVLTEYTKNVWSLERAAASSDSLDRASRRLQLFTT